MQRRSMLLGLVFAAGLVQSSIAGPVVGSEAFGFVNVTALPSGNINTATSFTFDTFVFSGTSGGYDDAPATDLAGPFVFNISNGVGGAFSATVSDTSWGSLVLDSFVVESNVPSQNTRSLVFTGIFTPASPGGWANSYGANTARVLISLNQDGGTNSAIGGGLSLVTPNPVAPPLSTGVPEPATYVAALLGVIPFLFARRRRL
jgi:hypothetical protein